MIKKRKGLVISELVIGIFLLVIFVFINISLYVNSYKNNISSKRFVQANSLLLDKIEDIQALPYENITEYTINVDNSLDESGLYSGKFDITVTYLGEVENPNDFYIRSELKTATSAPETDPDTGVTTSETIQYYDYTYYDDLCKIVKVDVSYELNGNTETYTISTLKVKPLADILASADVHEMAEIVSRTINTITPTP